MNTAGKGQTHWLVCVLVLVNLLSCKPSSTSESPGTLNGQTARGEVDTRRAALSKDEMIQIAKREMRNWGRDPASLTTYYDEDNQGWHRCFPKPLPELAGHDYQVIDCWDHRSEPVWILIDRKTGTILKTLTGYGPSLETRDGETLSKDEMIQAAMRVLRYLKENERRIYYDEDNQRWHRFFPKPLPGLAGHDYQAIECIDDEPDSFTHPLWLLIDKKTGTVLKVVPAAVQN